MENRTTDAQGSTGDVQSDCFALPTRIDVMNSDDPCLSQNVFKCELVSPDNDPYGDFISIRRVEDSAEMHIQFEEWPALRQAVDELVKSGMALLAQHEALELRKKALLKHQKGD
jgi:hypothetical protein